MVPFRYIIELIESSFYGLDYFPGIGDNEAKGGTMIKSALSHAGAAIFSILLAPVLIESVRYALPDVFNFFVWFGDGISDSLNSIFGIHTHPASFAVIPFVLVIASLWGLLYHAARFGKPEKYGTRPKG